MTVIGDLFGFIQELRIFCGLGEGIPQDVENFGRCPGGRIKGRAIKSPLERMAMTIFVFFIRREIFVNGQLFLSPALRPGPGRRQRAAPLSMSGLFADELPACPSTSFRSHEQPAGRTRGIHDELILIPMNSFNSMGNW